MRLAPLHRFSLASQIRTPNIAKATLHSHFHISMVRQNPTVGHSITILIFIIPHKPHFVSLLFSQNSSSIDSSCTDISCTDISSTDSSSTDSSCTDSSCTDISCTDSSCTDISCTDSNSTDSSSTERTSYQVFYGCVQIKEREKQKMSRKFFRILLSLC